MPSRELSIELTSEELRFLASATGNPTPIGLPTQTIDLPPEYEEAVDGETARNLRARRVLDPDSGEPSDAVRSLLGVLGAPALVASASLESDGVVETRFYTANPDLSVELRPVAPSVFRLTPFATRDVLARVLRFVDLRPAHVVDSGRLQAPVATLESCSTALAEHDHQTAAALLTRAGVAAEIAETFVAALKAKRASASVTILYRPDAEKVAGGQLTWMDSAIQGLWVSEALADDRLEITSRSAEEIARELLTYFPGPFSSSPPPPPSI